MSKLALKTEEIRVLTSDELAHTAGGRHKHKHKPVSSAPQPTPPFHATSSAAGTFQHTPPLSSAFETAPSLSSAAPRF